MRAILIDPENQSITEVDYDGSLDSIKTFIDADLFDVVRINEFGDGIFVDDEGLYTAEYFFRIDGLESPLAGKGLVLGVDYKGDSVPPGLESVETMEDKVSFITLEQAISMTDALEVKAKKMQEKYGDSFVHISASDILRSRE